MIRKLYTHELVHIPQAFLIFVAYWTRVTTEILIDLWVNLTWAFPETFCSKRFRTVKRNWVFLQKYPRNQMKLNKFPFRGQYCDDTSSVHEIKLCILPLVISLLLAVLWKSHEIGQAHQLFLDSHASCIFHICLRWYYTKDCFFYFLWYN